MKNINDKDFDDEISKGITLIDFWAEWCGPCKMLSPVIEEIAIELKDKIKVCKFNVDEGRETPTKFEIMGIPTLLLFKDGVLISQKTGMAAKKNLLDWINGNL
ncbi:MAG: thioredoxin [Rickettsiales bacterium]|jgi:thioredoxin 1|nr:thioredoxin [Rickettsiales bacterium]